MVYILCKRGLVSSDTPLYERKPLLVFHLWCDQLVVCMRVYTKIKNVHSQCFHTEKKRAQLELLLFINKCQYC